MFIGSIINQSPTGEFVNGGLSFGAYTAVALTENGVITAAQNSVPIGILLDDEAENVTVQLDGGSLWTAGESLKAGDFLSAGLSGAAFKSTSGDFIFAQALENAAQGATAHVRIIRAGKL